MAHTEIILTTNIPNLGAEADIVKVRRGYARNYLIPRGDALEVTPASLRRLNSLKAKRAEREARELNEATELGRRLGKLKLAFVLETGESGKAFGSITSKDIAEKIKAESGHEIDRHRIVLDRPIKESGDLTVDVKLHPEVTATLHLSISAKAPENAEAADGEAKAKRSVRKPKAAAENS